MKIGAIQAIVCVGLGSMLGFLAAKRDLSPSSRADDSELLEIDAQKRRNESLAAFAL